MSIMEDIGGTAKDWFGDIANVFGQVASAKSNAAALEAQASIEAQRAARADAAAQEARLYQLTSGTDTKRMLLYVGAALLMFALLMRQTAQAK